METKEFELIEQAVKAGVAPQPVAAAFNELSALRAELKKLGEPESYYLKAMSASARRIWRGRKCIKPPATCRITRSPCFRKWKWTNTAPTARKSSNASRNWRNNFPTTRRNKLELDREIRQPRENNFGIMHYTNRTLVLSANYADYADKIRKICIHL